MLKLQVLGPGLGLTVTGLENEPPQQKGQVGKW